MRVLGFLVLFFTIVGTLAAYAQQPGWVQTQCDAEIKKFCAGLPHEQGRVRACLEGKRAELSAACRKALDDTK